MPGAGGAPMERNTIARAGSRPAGFDGFRERVKAVLEPRRDSVHLLSLLEVLLDNSVGVTATVADHAVLQT